MSKPTVKKRTVWYKRPAFLWPVASIVGLLLIMAITFRVSPWPGAMIIRAEFTRNDTKTTRLLEKHQPAVAISEVTNQYYRQHDKDAKLDVYYPTATAATQRLPLVIWTHGGAWISGSKANNYPYYKLLAAKGFTVVSLDYTLGPEKKYPTAAHQLNDAYGYLQRESQRLHIDTDKVFLAGDSAGSQLSSQMAAIITNPDYAHQVGMTPQLKPSQLKGVVLTCGIYKMDSLVQPNPTLPKIIGWGDDVSVWAYTGTRDFSKPVIKEMSAYYHVTSGFPPAFITGGNADPLTDVQSKPLAAKLQALGVPVTSLFYPANHQPALPHEYQFNLDNQDGQSAFTAIVDFLKQRL